ncbi:MAG: glycosyltransferase family 4 protein [Candidatus Competibacterales bacterium]|nr:glycosyltransferase family 4 protein [Candidatus Competibacterales bacterium]
MPPERMVWLLATTLLVAATVPLVRAYALRRGLLDRPGRRRSHEIPTPRGGGMAIVVITLGNWCWAWQQGLIGADLGVALAGGGLLVAAVGFWEDHRPLTRRFRLTAQGLATVWVLYWLAPPLPVLPAVPWYLLAAVGLVWLTNLYNFMDGIDTLAASECVFVAVAGLLLLGSGGEVRLMLALLGAGTLGFLVWNRPPARIFMGDSGSCFIGFALGGLALASFRAESASWSFWSIVLGVFLIDATYTLLRRMVSGERWYEAHRMHAYQRAARRWNSHARVTLGVALVNMLWLLPLAALAAAYPSTGPLWVALAWLPLIGLAWGLGAGTR